jgi:hypothetical protein
MLLTTLLRGSNISPEGAGRYHGWYEISRRVPGADGFGKEDLTVARAGVREGTLLALAEGREI